MGSDIPCPTYVPNPTWWPHNSSPSPLIASYNPYMEVLTGFRLEFRVYNPNIWPSLHPATLQALAATWKVADPHIWFTWSKGLQDTKDFGHPACTKPLQHQTSMNTWTCLFWGVRKRSDSCFILEMHSLDAQLQEDGYGAIKHFITIYFLI